MPALPNDILLHVAGFIPKESLRDMLDVSSLFLDLALNVRYYEARFVNFDDQSMRLLYRLRDPEIACRVRRVHIQPWLSRSSIDEARALGDDVVYRHSASYEEIQQTIIDIVLKLNRTTEFFIEWSTLPPPSEFKPFVEAAWMAFSANLRVMSIIAGPSQLRALELERCAANVLRELSLEIWGEDGADDSNLLSVIAQFTHKSTSTLRKLSIKSEARKMDLSPLFHSLHSFPNLTHLKIDIPFEEPALSDPSGLSRFLQINNGTLREVSLMPRAWRGSLIDEDANAWIKWLEGNLSNEGMLDNISSLLIAVPSYPAPAGIELIQPYILRSADTLTSLSLLERPLTYVELDALTDALSHCALRRFSVKVDILTPSLLALLAKRLPKLDELELAIFSVTGDAYTADDDDSSRVTEIAEFEADIQKYSFTEWRLRDLSVRISGSCRVLGLGARIEKLVATTVPSIVSFKGVDIRQLAASRGSKKGFGISF